VPTDFALRRDGGGWTPRNPSVAVRLSDRAPGGYRFDDVGVTMRPLGLGDGMSRVLNDKLALLNAAADTDVLAAGIPQGLETFTTLRSPASPESFSWQLDLPPGASLRARPTGDPASVAAVDVVRGGRVLLSVTAPAAADAQGRSVPTTMSFAENTVTIAIAHRDKDFAYPITLDPQVVEGWSWIRDQHNNGFGFAPQYDYQTWAFASTNYGIFQWQEGNPQAPGLFQYQNGGTTQAGDWEEFYTNAGHPNTYIYEAIFADVNHYVQGPNYSFLVEGLWDIGAGTWQHGISSSSGAATVWGDWASPTADGQTVYGQSVTHCATPACSPEDQPPSCANNPNQVCQNYAVLQEYYPWGGTQGGGNYMGSVALYIGQKAPPTTDPINAPGGWQRGTINIGAHARDNGGLGLASLTLSGNTGQLAQAVAPCMYDNSYARGSHNDPCPHDLYGFSLDTTTMPDGYQPLYLNAQNVADRAGGQQQAAILVDNNPPTATITPALAPFVGQTVNIAGTAQDNASGVANWTAQVNGPGTNGQWQTVCSTTTSQNSAYSCPWDTTTLPDGAYQVQATGTDNAGNPYTTPIQNTTIHNTPPTITLTGQMIDNPQQTVTGVSDVGVYAADNPDDDSGPGIASVELKIDGADSNPAQYLDTQSCPSGGCTLDDGFPIDATQLSNGQHTIQVVAVDTLSNPSAPQTLTITSNNGQPADYSCPNASATTTPSGTVVSSSAATTLLRNTWASVAGLGSIVSQDGLNVLPVLDTTQNPPAVTGNTSAVTIGNQQPAFTMGSGTDKVCASRDTTTSDAQPAGIVSSPVVGGQPGSPVAELFANTSASTDTILRPTPTGVESLEQIRDSRAPQTFTWDVALHDGQQLQQLPNGDIAVVNGPDTQAPPSSTWTPPAGDPPLNSDDTSTAPGPVADSEPASVQSAMQTTLTQVPDIGAQLAYGDAHASEASDSTQGQAVAVLSAMPAVDANGTQVPTTLAAQGNQIIATVSHVGGGYAYPILFDPTATSSKAARTNGLGSNLPDTFTHLGEAQLNTGALAPRYARRIVPWNYQFSLDGTQAPGQPPNGDQGIRLWLQAVKAAGKIPVLTLANPQGGKTFPSVPQYQSAFASWLGFTHDQLNLPVAYWGVWNEPNGAGDPLDTAPVGAQTAADYWGAADRACRRLRRGCTTVFAGEFAGVAYGIKRKKAVPGKPPPGPGVKEYIDAYEAEILARAHSNRLPNTWSVHTYTDLIHVKDGQPNANGSLLRPFVMSLGRSFHRPTVWVTETGVQLRSGGNPTKRLPGNNELQTDAAMDFLNLKKTPQTDNRVTHAIYYTYLADAPGKFFDSGMLSSYQGNGEGDPFCPFPASRQQRPAYPVLAGPPPPPNQQCTP